MPCQNFTKIIVEKVTTVMDAHDKKNSVKKKAMDDGMGFALNPNFHIESDPSNIHFCKVEKHIMLVAKRVTIQFVQRQMMWPKNVCPLIPLVPKVQTQLFVFSRGKKTHHNAPHPG